MRHLLWLSIVGVLMTVAPIASASPYTITHGQLAKIDLRNQSLIPVGTANLYVVCLEYSADGFLYGVDYEFDTLIRIDPQTGASETVGPLGIEVEDWYFIGLAEDTGGQLWMLEEGGLYRVDRTTGAAALECQGASPYLNGLAFIDGQMVTSPGQGLPSDPGCGLEYIGEGARSIATGPDGWLYLLQWTSVPWDPFSIVLRFDPTTGVSQELANLGQVDLVGLAMSPDQLPSIPVPALSRSGAGVLAVLLAVAAIAALRRAG